MTERALDCVIIGYNEPPFEHYEGLLRKYGEDSEAYRDLKMSFVDLDGRKLIYVDLMNHVMQNNGIRNGGLRSGEIPNLAAAYLTNYLRRRGWGAEYINLFQDEKDRFADLLRQGPACVAITTTFYVLNYPLYEMVEFVREHNPDVKVVVGGPLAANHARNYQGEELDAALRDAGADIFVIEGQGEATLARIVACLREDGDLSKVPNIIYHDASGFHRTPMAPELNSLDDEYIDWVRLSPNDLGPTLQTRTARSCAFSCSFCNYPTRAGKLTLASLETIEKELESMRARGNVENVVFIDDTFNVPLPRFKDICRLMIRKRFDFNWFSYFRCSNSDDETVDLMAESGCKGVFLGIESGSPRILENMSKAATVEKYVDGIKRLHENDILTFGSFIIGFPGETSETVQETVSFIEETKPDYYRTQMWYNEEGTPIHREREKYGIEGDGFVWSHRTMDSLEAMDHIERIFLGVRDSVWLPQWSFDFWVIPYLMGKGISRRQFKEFMVAANGLLALDLASMPPQEEQLLRRERSTELAAAVAGWRGALA